MTPEEKKWVEEIRKALNTEAAVKFWVPSTWIDRLLHIIERQEGEIDKLRGLLLVNLTEEAQKNGEYNDQ